MEENKDLNQQEEKVETVEGEEQEGAAEGTGTASGRAEDDDRYCFQTDGSERSGFGGSCHE